MDHHSRLFHDMSRRSLPDNLATGNLFNQVNDFIKVHDSTDGNCEKARCLEA